MIFHAYGHPNIRGTHKNTLEFTKEEHLTLDGDCIVGVNADFEPQKLAEFARKHKRAKLILTADNIKDEFETNLNPEFNDAKEVVIRIGEHASPRTFGVRADKAARHLKRELIKKLAEGAKLEIKLEAMPEVKL